MAESNYGRRRKNLYQQLQILNQGTVAEKRQNSSRKGRCWHQQWPLK